jgi:hypothetical protein
LSTVNLFIKTKSVEEDPVQIALKLALQSHMKHDIPQYIWLAYFVKQNIVKENRESLKKLNFQHGIFKLNLLFNNEMLNLPNVMQGCQNWHDAPILLGASHRHPS